jgi:uroporphyrinogen decarboxylase
MEKLSSLQRPHEPNWPGLIDNILGKGTPKRVYHMELFQDEEIRDAIADQFELTGGLRKDDPDYGYKKYIAVQRFCGFDYVVVGPKGIGFELESIRNEDGNWSVEEHCGPITNWDGFEKYPWPDPDNPEVLADLQWYEQNLPEDMCMIGGLVGHFMENLSFLMGYETLAYSLFEQRDLVKAIAEKLLELYKKCVEIMVQFDRVKIVWCSDDMGFKTGTLLSPADMRELVLSGHKILAAMSHAADRPYLLHSCGKLTDIMGDLIDDVKIDAKHSFEDTIEDVREVKGTYGQQIALLGGIDVDFLCRGEEGAIRQRVRETLDVCMSGGRYCLGTGNSVAKYIPLDNYLAMVDEGRLYGT